MRNCSKKRVRLTLDERQMLENADRELATLVAPASPFARPICRRCGGPLHNSGFQGEAWRCHTCQMREAENPLRVRRGTMLEQAQRWRDARGRACAHVSECVGMANVGTAWFRTYRPTTESQRQALEAVRGFDGKFWCLVLAGGPGVGKSHLMAARFRRSVRTAMRNGRPLPTFATESDMAARWRAGFRQGPTGADDVLAAYQGERVLYIDDLGLVATTSTGWLAALGQVIEYRHRHQMPTAITTNLSSEEIARTYGPRILSRLATGALFRIDGPDARLTANRS